MCKVGAEYLSQGPVSITLNSYSHQVLVLSWGWVWRGGGKGVGEWVAGHKSRPFKVKCYFETNQHTFASLGLSVPIPEQINYK